MQAEAAHKQQAAAVEHARDLERELRDAWQEVQAAEARRQRDVHQAGAEAVRAGQAAAEDLRRTRKELTGLARELTECRVRGCLSRQAKRCLDACLCSHTKFANFSALQACTSTQFC